MPLETVLLASSDGVVGTDSAGRYLPLKHTEQKLLMIPYYWDPIGLAFVVAQQAGGGVGGAGDASAANQLLGNASLTSIDTKTPALVGGRQPVDGSGVTQPISAAALPLPAGAAQDGTDISAPTAMPAGGVGIRGWLSAIWTKLNGSLVVTQATPANLQATVTQGPAGAAAWLTDVSDRAARLLGVLSAGTNKIGTVDIATAPATAKGTQGANGVPMQQLKDAGRTRWSCATVIAGVAGVAVEALLSMIVQRNSAPGAAATTQAVTAAKRLRLTTLTIGIISTAAAVVSVRVVLRCNPTGALVAASPIELIVPIPSAAALAQAGGFLTVPLPEGMEYAGAEQFGLTHVGSVATYTLWASLNGYEY